MKLSGPNKLQCMIIPENNDLNVVDLVNGVNPDGICIQLDTRYYEITFPDYVIPVSVLDKLAESHALTFKVLNHQALGMGILYGGVHANLMMAIDALDMYETAMKTLSVYTLEALDEVLRLEPGRWSYWLRNQKRK